VAPRNLLNLEAVSKSFGRGALLDAVSLGIAEGQRIGVVGRNGGGKSTLLRVMAGVESADDGRVTVGTDVRVGLLSQAADLHPERTIRDFVVGSRERHDWSSDAYTRDVLSALLGSFDDESMDRKLGRLSGGERRRTELAALLVADADLLLLDEPTNHLDVESIAWLAAHLKARRSLGLVVVTHDRWFLDEVSDKTWEVSRGEVHEYDGGYSAYVLAKVERERQAATELTKRNMLIRKELAWLRRGPPARTSKPKFRIDAANELIEAEPPPRDSVELLAFAGARLGKTVLELQDASFAIGDRRLIDNVWWNIGPGDRIGIIGANGVGKTTALRLLLGQEKLLGGKLVTGVTIKPAYLSQHIEELDPTWRVLEAVERVASRVELGKGRELTASQLCERLGFGSDAQWTPVGDLSGGERRRLQLTRLLMAGPNVLVLDEPTNDFDVETLAALEDLLDSFGGTILVVSHDRYFLERVCDTFVGMVGDGKVRDLPGGVQEYLKLRRERAARPIDSGGVQRAAASSSAQLRTARKDVVRLERIMIRLNQQEKALQAQFAEHATDHVKVGELNGQLADIVKQRSAAELKWLAAAEVLENQ
jgi:ABC transport system ATP-binding/permease protein